MKTGSFISLSLLGLAAAQPQHGHRHAEFHKKRDVVVTDFQTVYETAPAAVVYVDDQGKVLYTSTQTPVEQVAAVPTSQPSPAVAVAGFGPNGQPAAVSFPSVEAPAPEPATPTTLVTSSKPPPPPKPTTTEAPPPPKPTTTEAPPPPPPAKTSKAAPPPAPVAKPPPGGSSSDNDGYGITYSPYNSDGTCKTADQVNSDFEQISGYSIVRSYGVDCNQVPNILSAAKSKGLKVFLGVFNIQPASQLSADIETLISAVDSDWSIVTSISIGNEDVNQGKADAATVVSATNSARSQLRAAGFSGPVVHVDTFNQLIAHPEICEASDYAAANCHAFFNPETTADAAGAFVKLQAGLVKAACGGKKTIITESGWPHTGSPNGIAVPSKQNQAAALASIKSSFSKDIFLFSAFDDLWKKNFDGSFGAEQYWGFLSS